MSLTKIEDHGTRALSRLAQQLKESATHTGFLLSLGSQVQALEDAIWDIQDLRDLDAASGDALDTLAAVVGIARDGSNDLTLRLRIAAEVIVNRSNGELDTLIRVVTLLVPDGALTVKEVFPAAVEIRIDSEEFTDPSTIFLKLKEAKAAGVKLTFLYQSTVLDAETFSFYDGPGLGFGDVNNPATGGKLTGAIS